MTEEKGAKWSRRKVVLFIILGLTVAAALPYVFFKNWLPMYLKFFQPAPGPGFAEYLPGVEGIFYVARLNENLYRGSKPDEGLDGLKALGIRTMINFRTQKSSDYGDQARARGLNYFWMPISLTDGPTPQQVDDFLRIVGDPAMQPVYFHCTQGIDRTGLMAGIYRIEREGWTNERARAEMNYFGHAPIWKDLGELMKDYPRGIGEQ